MGPDDRGMFAWALLLRVVWMLYMVDEGNRGCVRVALD